MMSIKIVIKHLTEAELVEQEQDLTVNQQIFEALKGIEAGQGFALPFPADTDWKKIIHGFRVFMDNDKRKNELSMTIKPHKSDANTVIVKRLS